MDSSISQHRDILLRYLIDTYFSFSIQNNSTFDYTKLSFIINILHSHQLLITQDSPNCFINSINTPIIDDKQIYNIYQSHKQSIDKYMSDQLSRQVPGLLSL